MDISKSCGSLVDLKERRMVTEQLLKEYDSEITQLETELVTEAQMSMTDHIQVSGWKFVFNWKNLYIIPKTNSDHSKKVELLRRLLDLKPDLNIQFFETGYIDDDGEIEFTQTGNMHKTQFDKFMDALPVEIIAKFVEDGLLFVKRVPCVEIRKVKG